MGHDVDIVAGLLERRLMTDTVDEIQVRPKIVAENINFHYGKFQALKSVSITIPEKKVTAFIGPSGCGKSTFLRCLNRMNDLIDGTKLEGTITIDGIMITSATMMCGQTKGRVMWRNDSQGLAPSMRAAS